MTELSLKYWFVVSRSLSGAIFNFVLHDWHPAFYTIKQDQKLLFYEQINQELYEKLREVL